MSEEINEMAYRLAKIAAKGWQRLLAENDLFFPSEKAIEEAQKEYVRKIREAIEKLDNKEE